MAGLKAVHARIEGRVQGVWYRAWTAGEAQKLALSGWVRNRNDGSVEAVFSGPDTQVDEMLRRCRQGPPLAEVKRIEIEETTVLQKAGFEKRSSV